MVSSNRPTHNYYSSFEDDVDYQLKIKMESDRSEIEGVFSYEDGVITVEYYGLFDFSSLFSKEAIKCYSNGTRITLIHCNDLWVNEPLKKTYASFDYALLQNAPANEQGESFQKTIFEMGPKLDIFGLRSHKIKHLKGDNLSIENELEPLNSFFGEDSLTIRHKFSYRSDDHDISIRHAHVFSIEHSREKNLREVICTIEQVNHLVNLLTSWKNEVFNITLYRNRYVATLLKNKAGSHNTKYFPFLFDIYQHETEWMKLCKEWPAVFNKYRDFIIKTEELMEEKDPYLKSSIYPMIFEGISQNIKFTPNPDLSESERSDIDSLKSLSADPKKRFAIKTEIAKIVGKKLTNEETERIVSIIWPKLNRAYTEAIKDSSYIYKTVERTKLKSILSTVILQRNTFAHSGLFKRGSNITDRAEVLSASSFMEMMIISSLLKECKLTNEERDHFVRDLRCRFYFVMCSSNDYANPK